MKAPRALLLAVALAAASPAIAQTTGSESCTTLIQSAANAASSRVSADDTDIPKPQSVKNFTCLDKFFNGAGLNVVVNLLNPTTLLNAVESEICNKLTSIWNSTIGKAQCGITLTGFKMGFLGGSTLGGGLSCPKISIGGGGPTIMSIGVGSDEQRKNLDHRQRRRPDRLLHHIPSWPLLRVVSMPKSRSLLSSAAGVLVGALVFGSSPAFAQIAVFDWANNAVQVAIKAIEQTMSNTLNTITGQLTATGPLGTLLGSAQYGSVTALLQQGFTQNANYAKAAVDAQSQIVDGALTSNARFQRDIRNAGIRDEHTTSSLHCAALDSGQTVTVSGGQSWKVTQSIQDVADTRGEAGLNQPAFYGQSQAVAAIAQLHFARYCSQPEAAAGLCSLSSTPNADQRASTLFGTGTLSGQAGVTAANDYVTNLVQPIVPAALRGDQLTSEIGRDAGIRRHAYNARISLARQVLDYAVGIQSPSVPLNSAQETQMQNEGLTPVSTGSWLQVLMLDANRRYSDVNYAAQLQAMPPASVNREIALELASTNYLLTQLLRVGIMHASTAAAHMAEDVEHDFPPTAPMSTPNIN